MASGHRHTTHAQKQNKKNKMSTARPGVAVLE